VINDGVEAKKDSLFMEVLMSGFIRNKMATEPWLLEANEKMATFLPSDKYSITNIDASINLFRERVGDGFSKSKLYQVNMLVERKQIHQHYSQNTMMIGDTIVECTSFSQESQYFLHHAKALYPYTVKEKGSRILRNWGSQKLNGMVIRNYGVAWLYMNGLTIDTSTEFIWGRPRMQIRKASHRVCKRCCRTGNSDLEPGPKWLTFRTTSPDVIWSIFKFDLDPDNPSEPIDDRSHKDNKGVRVSKKRSELGFEFDEFNDAR
jgi:hypothetical protein